MVDLIRSAPFTPDWSSPPGETLADILEERGWSQLEFAERTGYTEKHISLLINGKASITEDTALKLERVIGSTAGFWLSREARYRESIARADEERILEREGAWLKQLPLKHMLKNGWLRPFESVGAQVAECLRFFEVASVKAWETRYQEPVAAFRASKKHSIDPAPTAAWLRQGERVASSIKCEPYDRAAFRVALAEIRKLSTEGMPTVFVPKLVELCAKVGVAVVFEPEPPGCPVSGATKWLSPTKALLMLSLRHKSNDHLWFSFFHEAGHILLHGKKMMFIDVEKMLTDEHEDEANRFSRDTLIPPALAIRLLELPPREAEVLSFAKEASIAPGVVVGRMQNEKLLGWNQLNHLKVRYRWTNDEL
jgi:HTH-type transcriptional regulator / antitoxin HigA